MDLKAEELWPMALFFSLSLSEAGRLSGYQRAIYYPSRPYSRDLESYKKEGSPVGSRREKWPYIQRMETPPPPAPALGEISAAGAFQSMSIKLGRASRRTGIKSLALGPVFVSNSDTFGELKF